MTKPPADKLTQESLDTEALAWLRRLTSGQATEADAAALKRWRDESPDHARAFAEAALMWNVTRDATRDALRRSPALSSEALRANAQDRQGRHGRRAFVIGGTVLAASLAGALVVRPPLGLWPSLSELEAGYRTGPGERRKLDVTPSLAIDMNTRTSIDVRRAAAADHEINLIAGEAAITKTSDVAGSVVVQAGETRTRAAYASFSVFRNESVVRVTCIEGQVEVEGGGAIASLRGGQQIVCDRRGLGQVADTDPATALAWQRGLLVFQDAPLAGVIDEINRYRPGRIMLTDAGLAERRVIASFRIDRIEASIDFMTDVLRVPVRRLPGGIVLLG